MKNMKDGDINDIAVDVMMWMLVTLLLSRCD